MDTSNPAPMVNGEYLRLYAGRRVRCVIKVVRMESGGSVVIGQTADNHQVSVRQVPPGGKPPSEYVEVIGVVDGERNLRAELCTNFGNNFDMASYNQLCQMANGEYQDMFV